MPPQDLIIPKSFLKHDSGGNSRFSPVRNQKYLLILCGLPGAGKSAVAHWLEKHLQDSSILSRYNFLKPHLDGCHARVSGMSKEEIVDLCFYDEAAERLKLSSILIFDGTFHTRSKRKKAVEFAIQNDLIPILIYCVCDDRAILLERLKRQVEKGIKKFYRCRPEEVLNRYVENFEKIEGHENFSCFFLFDTIHHEPQIEFVNSDCREFANSIYQLLSMFHRITIPIHSLAG